MLSLGLVVVLGGGDVGSGVVGPLASSSETDQI